MAEKVEKTKPNIPKDQTVNADETTIETVTETIDDESITVQKSTDEKTQPVTVTATEKTKAYTEIIEERAPYHKANNWLKKQKLWKQMHQDYHLEV